MAEVTIGIDIGTTSVKAVAAADDGTVVTSSQVHHDLIAPDADRFEHDAAAAWVDGVLAAYETVAAGHEVRGATVSAMVPSMCGVDDSGRPVTPGLLYGDARGRDTADGGRIEGEAVGFAAWLAGQEGVAALWPAQAVANHALCGVAAIDSSTAMTLAPLFTGREWDPELLASLDLLPDQLPVCSPGWTAIGHRGDTAISGGTIDALAEQYMADAHTPGDVLVICGTTLIAWALTDEWRDVEGLWTIPYTVPGVIAIGGASNGGGLFVDHVRRLVGDPDPARVLAAPADGLPVWLPYIRGERTPFNDPGLRAALLDVRLGHGPAEILAAAHEATGFVVRHHLELAGTSPTRLVATGGGTRSPAWMQALADTTGLPVDVSNHPMGAALGAAFMGRVAAGLEPDMSAARAWARTGRRIEPRPDHATAADHRYRRFREALP